MRRSRFKNKLLQQFYRPYKENNFLKKSEKTLKEVDNEIEELMIKIFNKPIKNESKEKSKGDSKKSKQ